MTLPNNAFVVEYKVDDVSKYDIAAAAKQSEIFDHYYDKFKKGFCHYEQTEGRSNPKLWGVKGTRIQKEEVISQKGEKIFAKIFDLKVFLNCITRYTST